MASVKNRAARAGVKYLITHPRGRVTRFAVRFALRRVSKKVATAPGVEAIPAVRGSRLATLLGVVAVAGAIILAARAKRRGASAPSSSTVVVPPANAPFPAAAPPETRDAPPTTPTTSQLAEAVAATVGGGDDALVARVEAKLFEGTPARGVEVEATAGVVTLRGDVADEEAESRFVRDAEQVDGVKAVQSELRTAPGQPDPPAS